MNEYEQLKLESEDTAAIFESLLVETERLDRMAERQEGV